MSAPAHVRWTAYCDAIACGHGETKEEAVKQARRRLSPGFGVTRVVLRLRAYPFTPIREEAP